MGQHRNRQEGRSGRAKGGRGKRGLPVGSVGGDGRGVMSIIGFNIGALGKPVYKYPYATVITT